MPGLASVIIIIILWHPEAGMSATTARHTAWSLMARLSSPTSIPKYRDSICGYVVLRLRIVRLWLYSRRVEMTSLSALKQCSANWRRRRIRVSEYLWLQKWGSTLHVLSLYTDKYSVRYFSALEDQMFDLLSWLSQEPPITKGEPPVEDDFEYIKLISNGAYG